jgi:3-oxoadipate CoA-transferase alpha subunit
MCMAAKITIVQVRKITPLGSINPEHVTTPSLFVDRIVQIPNPISEASFLLNEPSL